MPLVSVIIPTHNRPQLLKEALASVKAQTFTDYEVIVVVNGKKTDLVEESIAIAVNNDCTATWLEKQGIAPALNQGLLLAKGEFIAFLDDDDCWKKDKLKVQIEEMVRQNADLSFCDVACIGDSKTVHHPVGLEKLPGFTAAESLMLKNVGGGCSATIARTKTLRNIGGFCEELVSPDWYAWIKIAWQGKVVWVKEVLVDYRNHAHNASKSINWGLSDLKIKYMIFRTCPHHLRHMRTVMLTRWLFKPREGKDKDLPIWWYVIKQTRKMISRITGVHLILKITGLKSLEVAFRQYFKSITYK